MLPLGTIRVSLDWDLKYNLRRIYSIICAAGPSACDRRRDIRHAKKHFPGIDFSHIECNKDEVYEKHHIESEHAVQERGGRFLQWLMARCPANRFPTP